MLRLVVVNKGKDKEVEKEVVIDAAVTVAASRVMDAVLEQQAAHELCSFGTRGVCSAGLGRK